MNTKYCSIIITHYAHVDDFGEQRMERWAQKYGLPPNRSECIRVCLASLKENTDFPCEVIVIDNGGNPDDSDWLLSQVREGVINTYVRNKNNMHFGWARMQGIALSGGDFVCICDNDLVFKKNWLSATLAPLLKHPEMKWIGTPYITPDKNKGPNIKGEVEGYRLNSMAGSNCMVMPRATFEAIGSFTTSHITGSHWHRRMNKLGYCAIAPPVDYVEHLGWRRGYNLRRQIKVFKELMGNREIVDYSFVYKHEGPREHYNQPLFSK